MKQFCVVLGLVVGLLVGWAQAEEKAKTDREKLKEEFKEFKPGSDSTYNWVKDLKEGLNKMKEDKCPGLLYLFYPEDKMTAFSFEKHIFGNQSDPEMSTFGGKFVTIMLNSTDAKVLGDFMQYRGRTTVIFLAPNGKTLQALANPSPKTFKRIATMVGKKFPAKAEEEKGEKKEGGEKKEKEEKKEEKKDEKKDKEQ